MKKSIDAGMLSQVNNQLIEQGTFSLLELLMSSGRLTYTDYERWRLGTLEFLDDALLGSPKRIGAQLEAAIACAESIGLLAKTQEFTGWQGQRQDTKLKLSADPISHKRLSLHFVSKQNTPQLDMFFNNPVVVMVNDVVDALLRRSLADVQPCLDLLYQQAPNHAELAVFDQLFDALQQSAQPVTDPLAELQALQQLSPHAKRLLGAQCRDYLVPLWRRLSLALERTSFSPTAPNLHNSYTLAQAQDWPAVSQAILNESQWWTHEILCLRLAECGYRRKVRSEALLAWHHLCWQASEKVPEWLNSGKWVDSDITNLWQQYCQLEDQLDLEEPLPLEDFPAWLLLKEPGLCHVFAEDSPRVEIPATRLFRTCHQLVLAQQAGDTTTEFEKRKDLQVEQPILLSFLKSRL
jgi:hypothetical protein